MDDARQGHVISSRRSWGKEEDDDGGQKDHSVGPWQRGDNILSNTDDFFPSPLSEKSKLLRKLGLNSI